MSEYKRLTKKSWHDAKFSRLRKNEPSDREILKRLWDLENKIEQGTLLALPCKVGSMVYTIDTFEWEVVEWYFGLDMLREFGKTVFLTKDEADAKMKGLKNDG